MTPFNFKKNLRKRELLAVIQKTLEILETPVVIEDVEGQKLFCFGKNSEGVRKYPVEFLGEIVGWVIGSPPTQAIAVMLSYMLQQENQKRSLASELLEKYQEIDFFYDLSTQLTANLNLKEVAHLVLEEVSKRIESSHAVILWLDQETGDLETLAQWGLGDAPQFFFKLGEGIVGNIVQSGKGEIVNNLVLDPRFDKSLCAISSLICVPLKTKARTLGAIAVFNEVPVTYTASDLKLLTMFATQVAVALEKALLCEESRTAAKIAQERAQQLQQALSELQQAQTQLIQSEKMSSLGQLVAGIAHEINNPVNFIYGNLNYADVYTKDLLNLLELYEKHYPQSVPEITEEIERIELDFLKDDLPKLLASMKLGVDRIRNIIISLRNFSRLEQAEMIPADLHEGIESTLLILHHRLKPSAGRPVIQVIKDYGKLPSVVCWADQLNQVLMNLISNAIDALEEKYQVRKLADVETLMPWTPTIQICTEVIEQNQAVICIRDNGLGMTEAVKEKLFKTFFTTKPRGKGTGFGLSISQQIIEKHGGLLKCFSQRGEGTEFWIEIPLTPQPSTADTRNIVESIV